MNFLDFAVYYSQVLGWAIFPLVPHDKHPITKNGLNDATTDIRQIEKWWENNRQYNIGLSCGKSGFGVIDLDSQLAIQRWHLILDALGYSNIQTPIADTAKGEHWYFQQPDERKMTNAQKGKKSDGTIDIEKIERRGVGGYVVLPPSIHPTGVIYTWRENHKPNEQICKMPLDLLNVIQPPVSTLPRAPIPSLPRLNDDVERHAVNIVKRVAYELSTTPSGAWHGEILNKGRYVGRLVGARYIEEDWAYQMLLRATTHRKDIKDSEHTLRQALDYGKQFPLYLESKY